HVRKSPSDLNRETRKKLLQKMVDNLQDRSLVDRVFVSLSSSASCPFSKRDLHRDDKIIKTMKNVTGNTSDMLEYFQSVDHNICLVSIDFAGLSSRPHLVKDLLEEYPAIKKIVIETFKHDNKVQILDSELLLSDDQLLNNFDCRKKLIQRSK
ncbi:hypothetical protein CLU79DRAFT_705389, partial [Phycomyces nitens]